MAIDKQVQPQPLPAEIPTDGPIEIELELPMQEGEEFADVLEMPQGEDFSENLADVLDQDVLGNIRFKSFSVWTTFFPFVKPHL